MSKTLALCLFAGAVFAMNAVAADDKPATGKERYFEMRTYTAAEGKADAMHARFRDHTNKLFVKHGIELIGYWTPIDKPGTLVYILAFPSKEARAASWDAFVKDPDWIKAKAESEKDGRLVQKVESVFMKPTDYSPMK